MSGATAPHDAHRPLVLLIEDDNRLAPALAMLIDDWGYECVAVRSPAAAVDKLGDRVSEIIAIVADLSREDTYTGRRSSGAIASALGTAIPLVATTNEPAMARRSGFVCVMAKPYDPEELRTWLNDQARASTSSRKAG